MLGDLIAARLAITAVIMSKHVRADDVDVLDDVDGASACSTRSAARGFDRFAAGSAAHARGETAPWTPRDDADLLRARARTLGPQTLTYDRRCTSSAARARPDRRRRPPLPRRLQQRSGGRPLPPGGRPGHGRAARDPEHEHALPARGERRARRAADRIRPARARPRPLRQLGQRGERPRAADRAPRHRPAGRAGDAVRLSRDHRGDVRALPRELATRGRAAGRRAARPAGGRSRSPCRTRATPTSPPRAPGSSSPRPWSTARSSATACSARPTTGSGGPRTHPRHGGLYVADEVQAGFGRTGDALWSVAAAGVTPDLSHSASRWATASRSPR